MKKGKTRILLLSDQVVERFYNEQVRTIFADVDMVISCGDLPYYYLEFILDRLNVPLYYVHGNHDPEVEFAAHGERKHPWGAASLHRKIVSHDGIILVGFEGSIRYSKAKYQFSQWEAWLQVVQKFPALLWNRIRYGRYLDILVTHSPAYQVGDAEDRAHTGFKAYRWFLTVFRPRYHFHGHIHHYDHRELVPQQFEKTTVINACPYRVVDYE